MLYRRVELMAKGLMFRTRFALLPGHFTGNGTKANPTRLAFSFLNDPKDCT